MAVRKGNIQNAMWQMISQILDNKHAKGNIFSLVNRKCKIIYFNVGKYFYLMDDFS